MKQTIVTPTPAVNPERELGPKAYTVLQAARSVFLKHGFAGATTDMIQREAGVSKSTVYAHFTNKETLFIEVVKAECQSSANTMRSIKFVPGQLKETLSLVASAYLKIVLSASGRALARMVIGEADRFPSLGSTFYEAGPRTCISMVEKLLSLAQAHGDIYLSDTSCEDAARVFVGLVRSEPQLYYLTHPVTKPAQEQVDHWSALVTDTFMRAYGVSA